MTEGRLHWSRWVAAGLMGATLVAAVVGIGIPAALEEIRDQKDALDEWLASYPPEFAQTLGYLSLTAAICLALLMVIRPRRSRPNSTKGGSGLTDPDHSDLQHTWM